jgi:2-polyprenyl-3-methyl-5-hydroxy-6-metoxy-1,4-benzoquinol methylase
MKAIVREHFETELRKAKTAIAAKDYETAWTALQRAHILGQAYPLPHAFAHWEMLKLAWIQRDIKEIAGQILPTVLAVPLTWLFGRMRELRPGRVNVDDSKQTSIPDGSTICDCGIGTGAFSLALAKTVSSKIQVIGVDISSQMLAKANQHFLQTGVNHQIYQSDVNTLPFHDNTFELVMSAHMLKHLPNPAVGLQEMVQNTPESSYTVYRFD